MDIATLDDTQHWSVFWTFKIFMNEFESELLASKTCS